jgi:hypothetical protein
VRFEEDGGGEDVYRVGSYAVGGEASLLLMVEEKAEGAAPGGLTSPELTPLLEPLCPTLSDSK